MRTLTLNSTAQFYLINIRQPISKAIIAPIIIIALKDISFCFVFCQHKRTRSDGVGLNVIAIIVRSMFA